MSFRAFRFCVVALAVGFFLGLYFWPTLVMAVAVEQVSSEYESMGLDVSDCKRQYVKTAACLKKPIRQIARELDSDAEPEGGYAGDERRAYRNEAPPLD
jgi:hypothetical protein